MSNVNGKAYAMNLVTPVYVKTSWLLMLIIPGVLIAFKSITYLLSFYQIILIDGWFLGVLFLLLAVAFLLAGLASWIGISIDVFILRKFNEYAFWLFSLLFFTLSFIASMNLVSAIIFGLIGTLLVIVAFILLKNGVAWLNRFVFWLAGLAVFQKSAFGGLNALSLIHYARWVILNDTDFPHLSADQPREKLKYGYMFFFSNFNGSWTQYVDSFSVAIPGGLNLLWNKNVGWKDAKVETPFNGYVLRNQIDTEYYYNAYPLASSNDVKSAKILKAEVISLAEKVSNSSPEEFAKAFNETTLKLQADLSKMEHTPIVSLAHEAIVRRESIQDFKQNSKKRK